MWPAGQCCATSLRDRRHEARDSGLGAGVDDEVGFADALGVGDHGDHPAVRDLRAATVFARPLVSSPSRMGQLSGENSGDREILRLVNGAKTIVALPEMECR